MQAYINTVTCIYMYMCVNFYLYWIDCMISHGVYSFKRLVRFRPGQPQVVNDADSARLLLEAGAQLEAIDDTGRTPLALAAAYGNLEAPVLHEMTCMGFLLMSHNYFI